MVLDPPSAQKRRSFLKWSLASGALAAPAVLACDGASMPGECPDGGPPPGDPGPGPECQDLHLQMGESSDAYDGWSGISDSEPDIRVKVLAYAGLACNAHNQQAWRVELLSEVSFLVFVDGAHVLRHSDPFHRQIHISLGAFLEQLDLAAKHFGHRADISYFPRGQYDSDYLSSHLPVAQVELVRDQNVERDPLFDQILLRRSNKEAYSDRAFTADELATIVAPFADSPYALTVKTDERELAIIRERTTTAMIIDGESDLRGYETIDTWNFTEADLLRERRGRDTRTLADEGVDRAFIIANKEAFVEAGIDEFEIQAASTPAYMMLTSPSNTRLDQLLVGRMYGRFNLHMTALGISVHPNSQILQEYSEMLELQAEFKRDMGVEEGTTIQMLVRLGFGPEEGQFPSPRLRPTDYAVIRRR